MCWCKLLSQCRCSRCGILCCKKRKTLAKLPIPALSSQPSASLIEPPAPQPVTELLQFRINRQATLSNSIQRESSLSTPTPSTTPEVNHLNSSKADVNTSNAIDVPDAKFGATASSTTYR